MDRYFEELQIPSTKGHHIMEVVKEDILPNNPHFEYSTATKKPISIDSKQTWSNMMKLVTNSCKGWTFTKKK